MNNASQGLNHSAKNQQRIGLNVYDDCAGEDAMFWSNNLLKISLEMTSNRWVDLSQSKNLPYF